MQQELDVADLRRISELIYEKYNYDFRNYAVSSFRRRVARILELKKLTLNLLLNRLASTPPFVREFIDELTVNVTEMFRDPGFWKVVRHDVIPALRHRKKNFNIWHAGCSSGEEVVTMCILLHEMGIRDDVAITATDLDSSMLERARTAAYPLRKMEVHEKNYRAYGAPGSLSAYYREENGQAIFDRNILGNVNFLQHDLVRGDVFDRFDIILCRNVMIYFNQSLQSDVLQKFHSSLLPNGYLLIGSKESLIGSDHANCFLAVNSDEKVYRKIRD